MVRAIAIHRDIEEAPMLLTDLLKQRGDCFSYLCITTNLAASTPAIFPFRVSLKLEEIFCDLTLRTYFHRRQGKLGLANSPNNSMAFLS